MEEKKFNLYQKIVEVRKLLTYLQKSVKGENSVYVPGSQIVGTIRGKMDELNLLLFPSVVHKSRVVTRFMQKTKLGEREMYMVEFDMYYTWIDADKPSDKYRGSFTAVGLQSDPSKSLGTAFTYSERYFLMKALNVPTDKDDPDFWNEKKNQQDAKNHNQPKPEPKPVEVKNDRYWIFKLIEAISQTEIEREKIKKDYETHYQITDWNTISAEVGKEIKIELQAIRKNLDSKNQTPNPNFGVSTPIHFDELDNSKKRIFALLKELFGDGAELQREKMKFDNGIKSFSEMNLDLAKKMISELEGEKKIREIQLSQEQF